MPTPYRSLFALLFLALLYLPSTGVAGIVFLPAGGQYWSTQGFPR